MFGTLADAGVNIEMISTSEVRITCVIEEAQLSPPLDAHHGAFELERFSLEPEKSRVTYLDFAPSGPHAFTCVSDDALRIAIAGPILVFYGKNKDGKKVEIYFDTKSLDVVKAEIEK